jgi:4'-phosphopantetheinyl transferase
MQRPVSSALSVYLEDAEVGLCLCSLAEPSEEIEQLAELLNEEESARAARFRFDRDRRRFIVARARLRLLLADVLGVDPRVVGFRYGRWGKPELDGRLAGGIHFNVSHSGDFALHAFSFARPIGCDLEQVRPIPEMTSIVSRWFAPSECEAILGTHETARLDLFFEFWTLKEAILKGAGTGLAVLSRDFELQRRRGAFAVSAFGSPDLAPWLARECAAPGGYRAAVAFLEQTQ